MNLYSEKVDGSVAPVETEMPVAKEQKRKVGTKKAKKVAEPIELRKKKDSKKD